MHVNRSVPINRDVRMNRSVHGRKFVVGRHDNSHVFYGHRRHFWHGRWYDDGEGRAGSMWTANGSGTSWPARSNRTTTGKPRSSPRLLQSGSCRLGNSFADAAARAARQQAGEASGTCRQREAGCAGSPSSGARRQRRGAELPRADDVGDLRRAAGGEGAVGAGSGIAVDDARWRRPPAFRAADIVLQAQAELSVRVVLSFIPGKLLRFRRGSRPRFGPGAPPTQVSGPGKSPPLQKRGGRRAKRRNHPYVTRSFGRVAPLGAPSRRLCGAGPRFLPFFACLSAFRRGNLFGFPPPRPRPAEPPAVSELLAGGRSAPGRNPGAARARWPAKPARGRRPDPREPEQPVRVPSRGRAGRNIYLD